MEDGIDGKVLTIIIYKTILFFIISTSVNDKLPQKETTAMIWPCVKSDRHLAYRDMYVARIIYVLTVCSYI